MHCHCCDVELTDFEATRKDARGVYLDMCNTCFKESGLNNILPVLEREDLATVDTILDDDDYNFEE